MKVISQRELRNDNATVIDDVEAGESYTVTRRGVPVARLTPYGDESGLRCVKPAKDGPPFSQMKRATLDVATAAILDDLRGDR